MYSRPYVLVQSYWIFSDDTHTHLGLYNIDRKECLMRESCHIQSVEISVDFESLFSSIRVICTSFDLRSDLFQLKIKKKTKTQNSTTTKNLTFNANFNTYLYDRIHARNEKKYYLGNK